MTEMRSNYEVKQKVTNYLHIAIGLVNRQISENQFAINDLPASSPKKIELLKDMVLLASTRSELKTMIQQYIRLNGLIGGTKKS